MCGLWGYTTNRSIKLTAEQKGIRTRIAMALGYSMQDRGSHSTGIGYVKGKDTLAFYKQAIPAAEFIVKEEVKKIIYDSPVILGHTRFATVGEITSNNAHPFLFNNVLGCHNGHVTNFKELYPKSTVDSESIFKHIGYYKNDFKKAFLELQGEFAITWIYGEEPNTVYLVKSGNPLGTMFVPELSTLFWLSTKESLSPIIFGGMGFTTAEEPIELEYEQVWRVNPDLTIDKTMIDFKKYGTYDYSENYSKGKYEKKMRENLPAGHICYMGDSCPEHCPWLPKDDKKKPIIVGADGNGIHDQDDEEENFKNKSDTLFEQQYGKSVYSTRGFDFVYEDLCAISFAIEGDGCYNCNGYLSLHNPDGLYYSFEDEAAICNNCFIQYVNRDKYDLVCLLSLDELYTIMLLLYGEYGNSLSKNKWKKLLKKRNKNDPRIIFKIMDKESRERITGMPSQDIVEANTEPVQAFENFVKATDNPAPIEQVSDRRIQIEVKARIKQ